jgi:small-conductance mechanosensitive channel
MTTTTLSLATTSGPANTAAVERLLVLVWRDLQSPNVVWQIAAIAVALAFGWWGARAVQHRVSGRASDGDSVALRVGLGGLKAVLWPLLALVLVLIARAVIATQSSVHLLDLAVPLLGSMVVVRAFVYGARYAFPGRAYLVVFERTIATAIWGAFALHISGLLPGLIGFLDGVAVTLGKQQISLWTVMRGGFWVLVIVLGALWLGAAVDRRLMGADTLHSSLRVALSRVVRAVLVVVGVLIALPLVGIDLTVLSVFGGALGVGIGFGLQKIASNYMSGFIILLERSVRLGDMVSVDNFMGEVKAITTRYVVVRALDGREAIIPNEKLITDTVLNHSFTDSKVRVTVAVQVGYRSDVERALTLLTEIAREHPRVIADPAPVALVTALGDNGIALECAFWIKDPALGSGPVRSDISLAIWRRFGAAGIDIPYPQREIRLIQSTSDMAR